MRFNRIHIRLISVMFSFIILSACLYSANTAKALVREPRLNLKTLSAARNTTYKLNVYNMQPEYTVTFSSSNTSVVTIRKPKVKSCKLRAKAPGTATITAEISDADDNIIASLKCKVTVSPSAVSIKFSKHKIKLTEGMSKMVKAIVKPNVSAEQPRYISDDPDIATVSSTGVVTAISEGQTTIRAVISNRKEAFCIITVESGYRNPSGKDPDTDRNNYDDDDNYYPVSSPSPQYLYKNNIPDGSPKDNAP